MTRGASRLPTDNDYNERFLDFFRLFAEIDEVESLFPKECRVCRTTFAGMAEYCCATHPKGHCFEDCRGMNAAPFMMVYRHCPCGNTLVLTLTEKAFPSLNAFWEMLHHEAEESGRSLKEVVADFADQCDCYLLSLNNPCAKGSK
jgi:hypothetical protein